MLARRGSASSRGLEEQGTVSGVGSDGVVQPSSAGAGGRRDREKENNIKEALVDGTTTQRVQEPVGASNKSFSTTPSKDARIEDSKNKDGPATPGKRLENFLTGGDQADRVDNVARGDHTDGERQNAAEMKFAKSNRVPTKDRGNKKVVLFLR